MPQRATGNGDRIKKDGKQKNKSVKPITLNYGDPDPKLQYNIPKGVDDDKKLYQVKINFSYAYQNVINV